ASVVVLGPLLARFGKAKVALPGGCAIGSRPIDMHIDALKAMGAEFLIEEGYIIGRRPRGGLRGAEIHFREVTVTGTENILMAATLAKGVTTIHNAACEPEVVDLANLLIKMGAKIEGAGTEIIRVEGVKKLHAAEHRVISDRIEAGTYLIAACATRGKIKVKGAVEEHLKALLEKLKECGAKITVRADEIDIEMKHRPKAVDIETAPFPGFATDLQAQMMALNCIAEGTSHIEETIFENRMMHVGELRRFGADIHIKNYVAIIHGAQKLSGAPVQASDLRASAALVTAALAAKGITIVEDVHHMDRGYEYIEEKLRALGAKIERIST
ncbi:MAG: UDP-N-acetylglucosamine 1-carboxyvinyltransferase, partial [Gammaproteobacteria bacterium]|nr:UDP-N-acetylglucosamine 1-carboxyvinyltransferase [Gammaproteobacteria bacterium]